MASAQLNEDIIITMLGVAPTAENGNDLRTAALLVLMDAYDRKIEREAFFKTAQTAVQMCEMMGRLESTTGVKSSYAAGKLTAENLDTALEAITGFAEANRKSLLHDMSLLIQCPEDDDTKH